MNTIEIMGVPYTIREVPVIDKDSLTLGQINYLTQEILIDETLAPERKKVVLLHEILHGICFATGLDQINEDERAVQQFATALYSTFKGALTSSLFGTEQKRQ